MVQDGQAIRLTVAECRALRTLDGIVHWYTTPPSSKWDVGDVVVTSRNLKSVRDKTIQWHMGTERPEIETCRSFFPEIYGSGL